MKIEINSAEYKKKINNLSHQIKTELQKSLYDTGKYIVQDIKVESRQSKSGRIYKRKTKSGRLINHTASSNTETSARMTGEKNKNTTFFVNNLDCYIGVDKKIAYARVIEFGSKFMQARQDLQKGLHRNLQIIKHNIEVRLKNLFKND